MNSYLKGKYAEFLARTYMQLHGFRIAAQNYVTGRGTTAGEVDFIAKRGKLLVFVEVKQRTTLDEAAYAIRPAQQQRILRGARSFVKNNPQYGGCDMRFDAILVALPWHIRHIPNAWHE
jgi:putative endonuclease